MTNLCPACGKMNPPGIQNCQHCNALISSFRGGHHVEASGAKIVPWSYPDDDYKEKDKDPDSLAYEIKELLEAFWNAAKSALDEDLQTAEAYNHDNPGAQFKEKDDYFKRANLFGQALFEERIGTPARMLSGPAKNLYFELLSQISNFEKSSRIKLNKGMICANLAVASLAEGDIDGGIAYMIWAMEEDKTGLIQNYLERWLKLSFYRQFAQGVKRSGKSQFGRPSPYSMLEKALKEYNDSTQKSIKLKDLFEKIRPRPAHRMLLEASLWVIHRNDALIHFENKFGIYRNPNNPNIYARLRIFDGFLTLCRFVEYEFKTDPVIQADPNVVLSPTLGNILRAIDGNFSNHLGSFRNSYSIPEKLTRKQDIIAVLNALFSNQTIPSWELLLLYHVRNYLAHCGDPDCQIFFQRCKDIFNKILHVYFDWCF